MYLSDFKDITSHHTHTEIDILTIFSTSNQLPLKTNPFVEIRNGPDPVFLVQVRVRKL